MTESMLTMRLSSVITPCGGKGTTVSRMSRLIRTLSSTGTSRCGPGSNVRLNFPSRSTTPTRCWRITLTELLRMKITASAMTIATIRVATSTSSASSAPAHGVQVQSAAGSAQLPVLRVDDRDRAVDLVDLDLGTGLDHHVGGVGPRRPALPADLVLPTRPVDLRDRRPGAADHLGGG